MDCQGAGSTTVIFLHSLGGRASDWNWTLSLIADASACKYDRLGVGRSEEAEERHTATDSAEELRELLEVAGISPPFVLVGHSFGGELALLYAGIHPEQVAGIVLVDAMLPFEAALDAPEVRDDVRADMNVNGELLYLYEAYAETDAVLHELPDVPITYMASTISPTGCACGSSAPRDVPPEWEAGAYTASLEEFMAGLPQGRLVRFESTHDMPSDIPDNIAAEVQLILEQVSS